MEPSVTDGFLCSAVDTGLVLADTVQHTTVSHVVLEHIALYLPPAAVFASPRFIRSLVLPVMSASCSQRSAQTNQWEAFAAAFAACVSAGSPLTELSAESMSFGRRLPFFVTSNPTGGIDVLLPPTLTALHCPRAILGPEVCRAIAEQCPSLTQLSVAVERPPVSCRASAAAIATFRNLRDLSISAHAEALPELVPLAPTLTRLSLASVIGFDGTAAAAAISTLRELRTLELIRCQDLDVSSLHAMLGETADANASGPRLEHFVIDDCHRLSEAAAGAIARCTMLRDLKLSHLSRAVTSRFFWEVAPALTRLTKLDISGIESVTSTVVSEVTKFPRLAAISLPSSVAAAEVRALQPCTALRTLTLAFQHTPSILAGARSALLAFNGLPVGLTHLDVSGRSVDSTVFNAIVTAFPALRTLDITQCVGLDAACFRHVARMLQLRELRMARVAGPGVGAVGLLRPLVVDGDLTAVVVSTEVLNLFTDPLLRSISRVSDLS